MKKLGTVTKVYRNKLVIIHAPDTRKPPRIGDPVLMPDGTPAGKVVDVIGPVDSPYVLVLPHPRFKPERLLGRTLYYRLPGGKDRRRASRGPRRSAGPRRRLRGKKGRRGSG